MPPEGTHKCWLPYFVLFLIGQLCPIKFGMRNTLPFQVTLDIKPLIKQNPDCSCVSEWVNASLPLGKWYTLLFGTMFNVIFDKCVPRQSFGQLDQCKKDRIVWDTQNLKSGEMSSLLIHEVQKKDFHWEIEINRVNIKNK